MATGAIHSLEPGSKEWWGPKIWSILHNLAWLSDRTDVLPVWKRVAQSLSQVMPCPLCRTHFANYMKNHPLFLTKSTTTTKGTDIKLQIVGDIWALHNAVNIRNRKEVFPIELLNAMYVNKTRNSILQETSRMINTINREWEPIAVKQFTVIAFREWRVAMNVLVSLINGGAN